MGVYIRKTQNVIFIVLSHLETRRLWSCTLGDRSWLNSGVNRIVQTSPSTNYDAVLIKRGRNFE